ncbi:MAG: hypothetical protein LUG95_05695 [Clostridiales bacterium]|nr:hypothetical protein [Clostridiales bacterium]
MKNLIWAVKLLFKADKWFLISGILSECASDLFRRFLQSVLLLRVLLSIIQGGEDFSFYVKNLIGFLIVGIVTEIISVWGDYLSQVNQKRYLNSLII